MSLTDWFDSATILCLFCSKQPLFLAKHGSLCRPSVHALGACIYKRDIEATFKGKTVKEQLVNVQRVKKLQCLFESWNDVVYFHPRSPNICT